MSRTRGGPMNSGKEGLKKLYNVNLCLFPPLSLKFLYIDCNGRLAKWQQ